jgi:hypothetical protein
MEQAVFHIGFDLGIGQALPGVAAAYTQIRLKDFEGQGKTAHGQIREYDVP